ncbi:ECs_2282 family putative zinc-binding protein [Paraburkholderia dinghuensis]|uniref:Uncharacterized protein n=1 Tax=Paraburkholderia dinghuensis TaxID=2305225 RepID=A0A3N6MHR9_9BURK|nr:hypothetical protein [Paraburkholderia dinghuensis]RQH02718.1 hypothetical protein D1Y85_21535 [Paraburkholderia dinghuensis]
MDSSKYNRQISMICPTCGGTDFSVPSESDDPSVPVTCRKCSRVMLRDELIELNSENIEAHQKEIVEQVKKDITKGINDAIRNAFKGNKNIKFK